MEKINLVHPFDIKQIPNQPVVLALGFFDGVHLGHQKVIKTAKKIADEKKIKLAVMTFNQSPSTIFGTDNENNFRYLTTITKKAELFEKLGVDYMYVVEFSDSFSNLSPQEFVDQYMIGLHANTIVAGFDYTYGKKDIANMKTLRNYSRNKFSIVEVPELKDQQHKVGTTFIKSLLKNTDIESVNKELGYIYENSGKVVHGLKRGRTLGFPTANVDINKKEVIPGDGVYITQINIDGKWYNSMTSVGFNITFDDVKQLAIETNILDFSENIYGKEVKLRWIKFLRNEVKFSGVDTLIAQLKKDELDARNYLEFKK